MTGDRRIRAATVAAVACVGLVAAVLSYRHQYELAAGHGESSLTARLFPLSVDGLLLAGTLAVLDASRRTGKVPLVARGTVVLGVAMTLWANVVHGLGYGPAGVVISGWPPVALIAAVEVLARMVRQEGRGGKVPSPSPVPAAPGVPEDVSALNGHAAEAARIFAADVVAGRSPSIRRIRRELHVGQDRAQSVQAYLAVIGQEVHQ